MDFSLLQEKIAKRQALIGVVGLGYVGLPVACLFADAGFHVIGLEVKPERVAQINQGISPIKGIEPGLDELLSKVIKSGKLRATTKPKELAQADFITINVETPVDEDHQPRYQALRSACLEIGKAMKSGALVILESTVAPGTSEKIAIPELVKSSSKKVNADFFFGSCPERVMPGKLLMNLRTLGRVCGGSTPDVSQTMVSLYQTIVKGELEESDLITAELVKTVENSYRDVQIAFANEVALICEQNSADFYRVRELVNKLPSRQVHLPGAGVGGHCIPKDPWLLAHSVREKIELRVIPAARAINDGMPRHMLELIQSALVEAGVSINRSKLLILGIAYLEDSDDTRNSPGLELCRLLEDAGAEVIIHDPWVEPYNKDLMELAAGCDSAILTTAHSFYKDLDLVELKKKMRHAILIDGRHLFDAKKAKESGFALKCIGLGNIQK